MALIESAVIFSYHELHPRHTGFPIDGQFASELREPRGYTDHGCGVDCGLWSMSTAISSEYLGREKKVAKAGKPSDKVQSPPIKAGGWQRDSMVWWGLSARSGTSASSPCCSADNKPGCKSAVTVRWTLSMHIGTCAKDSVAACKVRGRA